MVLCMVGTGLLWVGWYGFNAGSALAPDGIAANAFTTTTLATAVASFTWAMLEYALRGKPSVLGFCSGAVAGLVVITPACGYVGPSGAVMIGIAAGIVPFFACTKLKSWLGYDDALDTFGIHAVGGTLGAFLTGIFATASVNPNLSLSTAGSLNPATQNGLARIVGHALWIEQLKAIVITITLAVVGSALIGALVRGVIGLRIPPEIERQGLDINRTRRRRLHDHRLIFLDAHFQRKAGVNDLNTTRKNYAMKTSLTIAIFLAVSGIALAYTPAEIAAESKKANDFFEKCWDETLSRAPGRRIVLWNQDALRSAGGLVGRESHGR